MNSETSVELQSFDFALGERKLDRKQRTVCVRELATANVSLKSKMFRNNLFVAVLLAANVFSDVSSLPTSLLVDSKLQSDATIGASDKGNYRICYIIDDFIALAELIDREEKRFGWMKTRHKPRIKALQKSNFNFLSINCFV